MRFALGMAAGIAAVIAFGYWNRKQRGDAFVQLGPTTLEILGLRKCGCQPQMPGLVQTPTGEITAGASFAPTRLGGFQ